MVGEIISAIDARFRHKNAAVAAGAPRETLPMVAEVGLRVTDFHALTADFEHHNIEHQEEERRSAAEQRHHRVKELIDHQRYRRKLALDPARCPRGGSTWRERVDAAAFPG